MDKKDNLKKNKKKMEKKEANTTTMATNPLGMCEKLFNAFNSTLQPLRHLTFWQQDHATAAAQEKPKVVSTGFLAVISVFLLARHAYYYFLERKRRHELQKREVWNAISTTFFDGCDASLVYDLKRRMTRLKQWGRTIEEYYNELQGIWQEIDFRRPNPMQDAFHIEKYNSIVQEDRLYIFLDGLDDRLDSARADVLQSNPLPIVEQAYARVRREEMRQTVLLNREEVWSNPVVMIAKGSANEVNLSLSKNKNKLDKSGLICTHCGGSKHTKDTCFKIYGYPEWWKGTKDKKESNGKKWSSGRTGPSAQAHQTGALGLFQNGLMGSDGHPTQQIGQHIWTGPSANMQTGAQQAGVNTGPHVNPSHQQQIGRRQSNLAESTVNSGFGATGGTSLSLASHVEDGH